MSRFESVLSPVVWEAWYAPDGEPWIAVRAWGSGRPLGHVEVVETTEAVIVTLYRRGASGGKVEHLRTFHRIPLKGAVGVRFVRDGTDGGKRKQSAEAPSAVEDLAVGLTVARFDALP